MEIEKTKTTKLETFKLARYNLTR